MSRWAVLLAFLITACSHPAPVAVVTSSPSSEPTAAASPTTEPSSSPTATVSATPFPEFTDLPVSTVGFSCRLPFYKTDAWTTDSFMAFPAATATIDSSGNGGEYYDRAYSRWLPVPRSSVSPDGAGYAYIEAGNNEFVLHVVGVVSGKDTLIHLSTQLFNGQPFVFDYSPDGIYLVNAFEHLLAGLWLVDPATGSIRQISKSLYPTFSAGNGIIWTQSWNPADPNPVVTGTSVGILADEIDRVDLRTGSETEWLYEPGEGLNVVGLDGRGLPLIAVSKWQADPNAQLFFVGAAGDPRPVFKGMAAMTLGEGVTDSHGTWLSGQRGIYLYASSGVLLKVTDHPGYPANGCF